jgi:solute carrier family 30 (zinc transporter), member 5/7
LSTVVVGKSLRALCVFAMHGLLHHMAPGDMFMWTFVVLGIAGFALQRPAVALRDGGGRRHGVRIAVQSVLAMLSMALWMHGLNLVGALRALVVFEGAEFSVLWTMSSLTRRDPRPGGRRRFGAVLIVVGMLVLALFDHGQESDARSVPATATTAPLFESILFGGGEPRHHADAAAAAGGSAAENESLFASLLPVTAHVEGVLALCAAAVLHAVRRVGGRRVGAEVGGLKRLDALAHVGAACVLVPAWFLGLLPASREMLVMDGTLHPSYLLLLGYVATCAVFGVMLSNYLDVALSARAEQSTYGLVASSYVVTCMAGLLGGFWLVSSLSVTLALVVGFLCVFVGLRVLGNEFDEGRAHGVFIGYSAGSGLPLYSYHAYHDMHAQLPFPDSAKSALRMIMESEDSRQIFYFLCINFSFMSVEFLYGIWSNSLGLISDAFHMFFDCAALMVGLYASVVAKQKATRVFSYGYVNIFTGRGRFWRQRPGERSTETETERDRKKQRPREIERNRDRER